MSTKIRYQIINQPDLQHGKDLNGYIDVEVQGDHNRVPIKETISAEQIIGWKVTYEGETISSDAPMPQLNFTSRQYPNTLTATPYGLFIHGEAGARWNMENLTIGGGGPMYPYIKLNIVGVYEGGVPVIKYEMVKGDQPWLREVLFMDQKPNDQPLGFSGNAIRLGHSPYIIGAPPIEPDPPVVDPTNPELLMMRTEQTRLIQELHTITQQIISMGG